MGWGDHDHPHCDLIVTGSSEICPIIQLKKQLFTHLNLNLSEDNICSIDLKLWLAGITLLKNMNAASVAQPSLSLSEIINRLILAKFYRQTAPS